MSILLFRNSFRQMPEELFDAALIDGCGYFRFFCYVTLPLSRPILATVAVIVFVHSWNNYLLPLVVLNRDSSIRGRSASWSIRANIRPTGTWSWRSSR